MNDNGHLNMHNDTYSISKGTHSWNFILKKIKKTGWKEHKVE